MNPNLFEHDNLDWHTSIITPHHLDQNAEQTIKKNTSFNDILNPYNLRDFQRSPHPRQNKSCGIATIKVWIIKLKWNTFKETRGLK